jgi:hypothetical protein
MTRAERRASMRSVAHLEVELRIEELVLSGFAPSDRYAIGDALTLELGRLLEVQGLSGLDRSRVAGLNARAVERLEAGSISLGPDHRPATVGTQLAKAVHRRLMDAGGGDRFWSNTGRARS